MISKFCILFLIFRLFIVGFLSLNIINQQFANENACNIDIKNMSFFMEKIRNIYTLKLSKHNDIILNPLNKITNTLIFIHGLDNCANTYALQLILDPNYSLPNTTRLIFLQSPKIYVSLYNKTMNGWYNLKKSFFNMTGFSEKECYSFNDVRKNTKRIIKILWEEFFVLKISNLINQIQGKLYLAGFSQGCAMSLSAGIQFKGKIERIFCFSGHLFETVNLKNLKNKFVNIFHGLEDDIIPVTYAIESYNNKSLLQYKNVKFKSLEGVSHEFNEYEWKVLKKLF